MNRTRSILVGAWMLLLFATFGVSEEQSTLSKLNPFSKSTSTQSTRPKSNGRKAAPPSTWEKMKTGTKSALTKTNETINPWAKKSTPTTKHASTKQPANRPKTAEKKSFLSGLWPEKEEPKRPKTVSEFLAQPKPK